jgi:hypothetical protein
LLNRHTRKGIEGSNPSVTAILLRPWRGFAGQVPEL